MIEIWGLFLGLPLLAFGGGALFFSEKTSTFIEWFKFSRPVAAVLTILAWAWTAYECQIIGIDVFDMLLKRFPGQLVFLAALLSWLTIIWMPKHLSVRALTGILMLIPAELFKVTRLLVPESGAAPIHLFVVTAYIGAVIGMYGMFYPWRLEKAMAWFQARPLCFRLLGFVTLLWGAALIFVGMRG
jgi:hypothetical protein